MKQTKVLLLLIFILLLTAGCEEKKSDKKPLFVENTTEVFTQKDKQIQEKKQQISMKKSVNKDTSPEQADLSANTYILKNISNDTKKLTLGHKNISFENVKEPVVLLTVFSSLSHPYLMQTVSFEKLQKKFKDSLFIASISSSPVDHENRKNLTKIKYFISNDKKNEKIISSFYAKFHLKDTNAFPLTVIYKDKSYYSHFEGAVPIEMLQHEIQQAIQN